MNLQSFRSRLPSLWLAGLTSLVAASLVACGGGGSSAGAASTTSSAQTYSGTVTGLGSIVVNGVRFSTADASAADADDPTQPYTQAFKLGTTVIVNGSVDSDGVNGQATSIQVEGGVRGQIAPGSFTYDAGTTSGTLTVAGQLVKFDSNTVFDGEGTANFTAAWLATNDFNTTPISVEVYGAVDGTGTIVATRIEKKDLTGLLFAVKGYVVNGSINTTAQTFDMLIKRGLTLTQTVHVNYAGATVLPNGATLHDGVGVRVLSSTSLVTLDPTGTGTPTMTASKLLIKSDRGVNGSAAKLHGVVTAINGTTWTIGDVTIDVSKNPILRGFSSLSDVVVGTEVRVAGLFKDNVLTAKFVESDDYDHDHDGGGVKLFGVATGVDTTARTFSVQGVTVTVPNLPMFNMPTEGAYVEVIATQINGVLTAVRISGSESRPFEVFGTAACTNGTSDLQGTFALTLPLGTVSVDGSAARIEAEDWVNLAASGTPKTCLLEVKGTMTSVNGTKTIAATKIEIKRRF
ncbi:MAG TPA: DUF5666 domain-containing protein [Aquabacterium sp.]|nr:DUF5666 domain-containing protein [Aquabacterium sp.]